MRPGNNTKSWENPATAALRDHTALGVWSVAQEIAWAVEALFENPRHRAWMEEVGVGPRDLQGSREGDWPLPDMLYALAGFGLETYDELVAEWCQANGEEARELLGLWTVAEEERDRQLRRWLRRAERRP